MTARPTILLTRPHEKGAALARVLEDAGWRALLWPLTAVETIAAPPDLSRAQAVLFTSAAAAERTGPAGIPAFCVGATTAAAARRAGFADVRDAAGDAAALAALICASLDPQAGPLVLARGADTAFDLAGALGAAGFSVTERVLYAAAPTGPAPARIAEALQCGAVDCALFYSPRAASLFAGRAAPWREGLSRAVAVAISRAVAAPLSQCGFGAVRVASAPTGAAMREQAESLRVELRAKG